MEAQYVDFKLHYDGDDDFEHLRNSENWNNQLFLNEAKVNDPKRIEQSGVNYNPDLFA